MSEDRTRFNYEDLLYIRTRDRADKRPLDKWGGYDNDLADKPDVYTHEEVEESEHDHWAVVDAVDGDHMTVSTLVFDLDIHKAPPSFDEDRVSVPENTTVVKSQNGGFHVYFKIHCEPGELQESDFEMAENPGWDVDIRGSAVSAHVVAPADVPGVDTPYNVVNDYRVSTQTDPADAATRIQLDGEPLLKFNPDTSYTGNVEIDRDVEPPDEMPTCYHRGLQLREANPDDHEHTHKVNVLTALSGLAAGYDVETVVEHFISDYAPGENADREKTEYQVNHLAEKLDRGDYSPPAVSTLREYGILDSNESCACVIPYHGKNPAEVSAETIQSENIQTDGGTKATQTDGTGVEPTGPTWKEVYDLYDMADDTDAKNNARYQASEVLLNNHHWRNLQESDQLYWYDPDDGIYKPTGETRTRTFSRQGLRNHYTQSDVREFLSHLRAVSTVPQDEMGGPQEKVAVGNGVLDLKTRKLTEHRPDYNFLSRLNTDYDPDADCPRFRQFLDEVVPDESAKKKLQEYAGYTLMHWKLKWHKALFIVGPQNSGKSTFADAIRAIHGADRVASLSPQEMTQRFGGAELYGKWVNIRNDIPASAVEKTGTFKEIVAGDPIKAERKRKDPFMFKPTAKHIFVANQLPDTENDDAAFYRRILLVAFPHTVPREDRDRDLDDKLRAELPGILNWALDGLARLRDQGNFTGDLTPSLTAEEWDKWGHTVDRFASACLTTEDPGDVKPVPKSLVYTVYQAFCEAESMPCEMQQAMTRRLKTEHSATDGKATVNGEQQRCFLNLAFTERAQAYMDGEDDPDGDQNRLD